MNIEALFLYATEGILVTNDQGQIIRINPTAERMFGYEKDELTGKKVETLVPSRLSAKHVHHREEYFEKPHPRPINESMDFFGLKKNGTEFPVEISLSPYTTEEGKFTIAFVVDITVRKQAEEKLKNYSEDLEKQVKNRTLILEEAISELEKTKKELYNGLNKEKELSELKSRFVSMASHEFRTPLTTMASSLFLAVKYGELDDKENQTRHLDKIKNSIKTLTDILDDFLSVRKLEEGKIENNPEKDNLKVFIAGIITEMEVIADGKHIRQRHSGKQIATFDKKLMKNVLFNLISNAIKYSFEDGTIEVFSEVSKPVIKISVKDDGMGIPEEDQKNLFERFFRGNNTTHIQGTGLGLNIVAKYLELMHATIDFISEENNGTKFNIEIPQTAEIVIGNKHTAL